MNPMVSISYQEIWVILFNLSKLGDKKKRNPVCASRVKGLPTKKKYSFRVLAENLAGPGKPSVETDPILIKDPIG